MQTDGYKALIRPYKCLLFDLVLHSLNVYFVSLFLHNSEQLWTQVKYGKNPKAIFYELTKLAINCEYQRRKIFFLHKILGQQISEADLMLTLNEVLQNAGEGSDVQFS